MPPLILGNAVRNVPLRLVAGAPGLIDTLHYVDGRTTDDKTTREALGPTEVDIYVRNVGLNFKDRLAPLGWLNERTVRFEVSGTVIRLGTQAASSELGIVDRVASVANSRYRTLTYCH
jgi:NADPH:quinone reductase-like Zn-dependent oxidoreductase